MAPAIDNCNSNSNFTVSQMEPSDIVTLANQFVVQYYTVLKKCPSGIHRFYKEDSSILRDDEPVYGQRMIHEKVTSMGFQDTRVAILQLDALRAFNNSVLIQVSGEICTDSQEFRRFTQTFILREQAPCDFYILNDIFRYQDVIYGERDNKMNDEKLEKSLNTALSKHTIVETTTQDNIISWDKPSDEQYKPNMNIEPDYDQINSKPMCVSHAPPTPNENGNQQTPTEVEEDQPVDQSQPKSWAQMAAKKGNVNFGTQPKNMHTSEVNNNNGNLKEFRPPNSGRPSQRAPHSGASRHQIGTEAGLNQEGRMINKNPVPNGYNRLNARPNRPQNSNKAPGNLQRRNMT